MYKYLYLGSQDGLHSISKRGFSGECKIVSAETLNKLVQEKEILNLVWKDGQIVPNSIKEIEIKTENRVWFAEITFEEGRFHTGANLSWDGMTYTQLKKFIKDNYGVELPTISELKLIKQTRYRKIYEI